MIIDGHSYSFPPMDSAEGFATLEDNMRAVQSEFSGHHQPVWRVRDRAPADNDTLIDPETRRLRDVRWTRDIGRLVWEYDGETYTKQYLPPLLHNLECPPEVLIAEMDYAGVDMAVLHQSPQFGVLNEFLTLAVNRYPSRLVRLISVRDGETPGDPDAAIQELEGQAPAAGSCGFQFFPRAYYLGGNTEPWDDGAMRPFWEAVAHTGMPVYFTLLGARVEKRYSFAERDAYLDEQRILMRWMERYPDATVVVTHGLPWRSFLEGDDHMEFPKDIWEPFRAPQCHLQLLFPIQLGGLWEYPWRETEPTVKECLEHVGADRLIWGTDMPMVARFCTYRQTIDQYRVHCEFLSDSEREAVLGGTVARVMGIG